MSLLRSTLPLLIALAALWYGAQALDARPTTAVAFPIDRPHEAVVIPGSTFAAWLGAPLEELALYRYGADGWQPVLFQVDEVDDFGVYVSAGDGLLGAGDELVFMGIDSGDWVSPTFWISDSVAWQHARHVITVTDPLDPEAIGWVYLYRSAELPRAAGNYVAWDNEAQMATAVSYTLAFTPDQFLGLSSLTLNNQPQDVLDRQKLRVVAGVYFLGFPVDTITLNEEEILDLLEEPITLTLPITGPGRAIGGAGIQQAAFYGRQAQIQTAIPVSEQPAPGLPGGTIRIQSARLSLDMADPTVSGLAPAVYYDSNLANGIPVDGVPDSLPTQPLAAWQQIDGDYGGFVSLLNVSVASGQTATFYRDNAQFDPNDTGDGRAYGDHGFTVTNPDGLLEVDVQLYFLGGQQGRQGEQIAAQAANPLQISVSLQPAPTPPPPVTTHWLYLPLIKANQTTIQLLGQPTNRPNN